MSPRQSQILKSVRMKTYTHEGERGRKKDGEGEGEEGRWGKGEGGRKEGGGERY